MNLADFVHRSITGAMAASIGAAVSLIVEIAPFHGLPQLYSEFGLGDMSWAILGPVAAMGLFLLARDCVCSPSERFDDNTRIAVAIVAVVAGLTVLGFGAFACYERAAKSFANDANMVQQVGVHYPGRHWDVIARWALMPLWLEALAGVLVVTVIMAVIRPRQQPQVAAS